VILGRASARPRRRGGSPGDGAGRGIWAGYRPGAGRLARSRAGVRDRIRPAHPWPGPAARPAPHRSHGRPGTDRAAVRGDGPHRRRSATWPSAPLGETAVRPGHAPVSGGHPPVPVDGVSDHLRTGRPRWFLTENGQVTGRLCSWSCT